jgi:hypothetical protein
MNKPDFNFGDLVRVDGYGARVFVVDGYREERYYHPDESWTDIVYELHCAWTGGRMEADEEDLTLVAPAENAEEYLATAPIMYGGDTMKQPKKPTAKEEAEERKKRAEQIDNLLDMRNWYSEALERTNNEEFADRMFAIDAELKKLVEND